MVDFDGARIDFQRYTMSALAHCSDVSERSWRQPILDGQTQWAFRSTTYCKRREWILKESVLSVKTSVSSFVDTHVSRAHLFVLACCCAALCRRNKYPSSDHPGRWFRPYTASACVARLRIPEKGSSLLVTRRPPCRRFQTADPKLAGRLLTGGRYAPNRRTVDDGCSLPRLGYSDMYYSVEDDSWNRKCEAPGAVRSVQREQMMCRSVPDRQAPSSSTATDCRRDGQSTQSFESPRVQSMAV
jgi:hypothetical protein